MSTTIDAVYENGVFRPLTPVAELAEGAVVLLTVRAKEAPAEGEQPRLSSKEIRELMRAKNPEAEIPEAAWEELDQLLQISLSNVRDPETMRQAAERMDQLREQIYQREGLLDIAVPYLREARDEE